VIGKSFLKKKPMRRKIILEPIYFLILFIDTEFKNHYKLLLEKL
jgi:hypothetical protein